MTDWTNLDLDGKRLNRIIRILETRLKKCQEDDKIIQYCNSIGYITLQKVSIAKIYLGIEDAIKQHKELTQ